MTECQGCGKKGEDVRPCCGWEGYVILCDGCRMKGKYQTPGHICGRGIEGRTS